MSTTPGRAGYFLAFCAQFLLIPFLVFPFSNQDIQWPELALFIPGILLFVLGSTIANQDSEMKRRGWKKWLWLDPVTEWRFRGDRTLMAFGMMMLLFTLQNMRSSGYSSTFLPIVGLIALLIGWLDVWRSHFQSAKNVTTQ